MKIVTGSDRYNNTYNNIKVGVNFFEKTLNYNLEKKQKFKSKKQKLITKNLKPFEKLNLPTLKKIKSQNPISQIKIRLASPEQIKEWCSRIFKKTTIGEIQSAQTVDYKTLDPKKDGLFCERIFGPAKDFQCFCKKKKKKELFVWQGKKACKSCGVEHASKRVRRYNLGYIQLSSPVTHIWFLRGRVSYLSILLGYKRKALEQLTICKRTLEFTKNKKLNSFLFSPLFFTEKTTYNYNDNDSLDNNFLNSRLRFSSKENKKIISKEFSFLNNINIYKVYHCEKTSEHSHRKMYSEKIGSFYYNLFKITFYKKNKKKKNLLTIKFLINSIYAKKNTRDLSYSNSNYIKRFYRKPIAVLSQPYGDSDGDSYGEDLSFKSFIPKSLNDPKTKIYLYKDFTNLNRSETDRSPFLLSESSKEKKTTCIGQYDKLRNFSRNRIKKKKVSNKTEIEIPTEIERVVKSFLQPTICPFSPEIIKQFLDPRRIPSHREVRYDKFNKPIWCDQTIFIFFTVLPKTGDIPIPEYSQLTEYSENNFLQSEFYLPPLLFHQKQVGNTGGFAIKEMLKQLNLLLLGRILKKIISKSQKKINLVRQNPNPTLKEVRRLKKLKIYHFKKVRRAKITRNFINSKVRPEWMTLSIIPVLPPALRPIIRLDGNQLAVSDLNKIYQTIFYRNQRILNTKRLHKAQCVKEQALLQRAVDALIDNGKGGDQSMCALNGRPLKSLSDILKGKKGRFRLTLLGKRVDYSGRSVIVVGPTLLLHQCGLPKEMAIELFKPFLIRYFIKQKKVKTIVAAKQLIDKKDLTLWSILEEIMAKHFVFLNRAPTLHRLGIQGFQPKLVNGRAILLHPLVCTAFNADFDGDQMAVHIPLSLTAQTESRLLMSSTTNILSPATGQPILVPSQDMILGCNYLTYYNSLFKKNYTVFSKSLSLPISGEDPVGENKKIASNLASNTEQTRKAGVINFDTFFSISSQAKNTGYFSDFNDLLKAYYQKKIDLHAPVWVRTNLSIETEKTSLSPLEMRIYSFGEYNQLFSTFQLYYDINGQKVKQYLFTTPGRVLINQIFFNSELNKDVFKEAKSLF